MRVFLLDAAWVEPMAVYLTAHIAASGVDGEPIYAPYEPGQAGEVEPRARSLAEAWARSVGTPGWKRAFGVADGAAVVGHCVLHGGQLTSDQHRVTLGMGVDRPYRRRGLGRRLLGAALAWARAEPGIAWVELGVFGDNAAARALYESEGFEQVGTRVDRFRVGGQSIDDHHMVLRVGD